MVLAAIANDSKELLNFLLSLGSFVALIGSFAVYLNTMQLQRTYDNKILKLTENLRHEESVRDEQLRNQLLTMAKRTNVNKFKIALIHETIGDIESFLNKKLDYVIRHRTAESEINEDTQL